MKRIIVALLLLLALPLGLAKAAEKPAADKLNVVASFSILADFVKAVGGDRVEVSMLVGPNGDAHVYTPAPADAKKVNDARLVFINGLGFEGWLDRLIRASGRESPVIVTTIGVTPRKATETGGHGHNHNHGSSDADPHAWQSVANARIYITNIRDALVKADPDGKADYEAAAAAYLAKLDAVDREIKETVARLPPERRRVISTHAAFGYFEDAYGIDFIAPQGVSTESEASARDVGRIINQIKKQNIPAVFLENISDPRLIRQISDETGARVGGTLYSDALTDPSGPAPTYLDMMRHNLQTLSAALAS